MAKYKIADVVFEINAHHDFFIEMAKKYICDNSFSAEFNATVTEEEIKREKNAPNGKVYTDAFAESLAVYRKISSYLIDFKDGFLFHASAVSVDNRGVLFTAHSGTGKSTHARLWQELLGDRFLYVNDDKPVIREINGEFFVYGTPWSGKHKLDNDIKVKIEAVAKIQRSEKNFVNLLDKKEAIALFMEQSLRFPEKDRTVKYLQIISRFLNSVNTFVINCNTYIEAGKIAVKQILGETV